MQMKRVEGILAVSSNNVVGQGSAIPWHHSGDFKRFKSITMGHGVLMGYPTFVGMVKNYTKPGNQVLPGRVIFVVGRAPFDIDIGFDDSNVVYIETHGPKDDIETCLAQLNDDQILFISGGARIYRDYLPYAERLYLTRIDIVCPINQDTVLLNSFNTRSWRTRSANNCETDNKTGLRANYYVLSSVL